MATKATIRSGYRNRLGIIAIILFPMGGWFLYDAMIGYPAEHYRWEVYDEIQQAYPDDWQMRWDQRVRDEGWPRKQPTPRENWDIPVQYLCAFGCFTIGLFFVGGYVMVGRRWVAADEAGLSTHDGRVVPWDNITAIDKSRWKNKGIAIIHYRGDGGEGTITLDDWKYDTDATGAILSEVEARTGLGDRKPGDNPNRPPQEEQPPQTS